MKVRLILSSAALAAALSLSGGAFAQNMLNGVEIPLDQVENFKGKCEALQAEATASLTTTNESGTEDDATDPTQTGTVEGTPSETDSPDPAAQENWPEALASLTLEECEAAGFGVAASTP